MIDKLCRKCKHYHITDLNGMALACEIALTYRKCSCIWDDYIPGDNLEYLEWCLDKRRLKDNV